MLIEDEIDAAIAGVQSDSSPVTYHEHRYRGGMPSMRLRRMHIHHEGRARRAGLEWEMVDFREVYAKYQGRCGICGHHVGESEFTIDHIVPLAKGGAHVFRNLQPAHRRCNSQKRDRLVEPAFRP